MLCRERRSWTAKEDQLLRDAVEREDPENPNPSKWHAIAKHVPNRTNKDCRKRWFAKMASDVVKGGWAPEEDEKLVKGIERYGTRWSLVASVVQSRNSDQCAKRWTDTLNPAIDRTTWSTEADELLLQAVNQHGKVWTKIVKTYFPGRTGLSAKNRYNSITRFSADHSRSVRPRRGSPENISHASHRKRDSISSSSSSSSTSVSPTMSSIQIPESSRLLFPSSVESGSASYFVDPLSGWSSSSSETGDDFTPYTPTFSVADINTQHSLSLTSTSSTDSAYQLAMDHTLSTFLDTPHLAYPSLSILGGRYPEERRLSGQTHTHVMPFQDMTPFYPQRGGLDMPNHFGFFEPLPSEVDGQMGLTWGNIPMALETKHRDNQKVPPTGDSYLF